MKVLLLIVRFIVGTLFIFSGLIKANDPLGLSYKMQEFFEVWNIHWLDQFTLALSICMIVFEILAGVAVLLGWKMKFFSWLLLLLIVFFTFLTGYAYFSGKIKECGCFGNCIPLTAGESFAKDLALLILILFLFAFRGKIKPFLPRLYNLTILFFSVVFSFSIQWYVLEYLPVVDCLPFKVGVNIYEQTKPPPGSVQDSTVISFVYSKNGKEVEFTADRFPADFDDSYKFVKRYDKQIRKGNAESAIKDFTLVTASGNDTTLDLLNRKGYTLFMFAKEIPDPNPSWNREFAVILSFVKMKNMTIYFITAHTDQVENYFVKNNITDHVQILKCDVTAIKTAARADPTLYLLKQGTILNKWSHADFESAIGEINSLPVQ
ncbi:MAG TPA: BT_3928 family protein [Puia sp.]|nr:BT_3928 family protein [Puia sp.]